jgi:hypothetical protein
MERTPIPDVEELSRLEDRGLALVTAGIIGGVLIRGVLTYSLRPPNEGIAMMPVVAGYLLHVWGCTELARARGFRSVHGLVGLMPVIGVIFVTTRAKPEPGDGIDRDSWHGFLTAPFAWRSDLSSSGG